MHCSVIAGSLFWPVEFICSDSLMLLSVDSMAVARRQPDSSGQLDRWLLWPKNSPLQHPNLPSTTNLEFQLARIGRRNATDAKPPTRSSLKKHLPTCAPAFQFPCLIYTLTALIPRQIGERNMQGLFEYKLDSKGDAVALDINLDSVSAKALVRLDRYINWEDILKLTENDPEAARAAERLHTVLQHLGQ